MTVQSSCWIGIDTGGTFTDVVLADRASGSYWFRKVPSNPADPAEAILRGLDEIWPRRESAVSALNSSVWEPRLPLTPCSKARQAAS